MEKVVRIVKKGEDNSNLQYWLQTSYADRLKNLEEMRQQFHQEKYEPTPRLQRIYRVIKRS